MSLKAFHDPGADVPCFNPMRAAIKLADNVNTVSPTYAQEITLPDCAGRGFKGGRGLEDDFKRLANQGKLHGILNALDYDVSTPLSLDPPFDTGQKDWQVSRKQHKVALLQNLSTYVQDMEKQPGSNFFNQRRVLEKSSAFQPDEWLEKPLVVAVSRAASQKLNILLEPYEADCLVIEEILKRDIFLLLLGTGELQDQLERINDYTNGLFICAFDPDLAQKLYAGGDIFLMPSDFEPCGLSQMIAMRYGCLPLAHDIGGLHDTIRDSQTGFLYAGADREDTRHNLLRRLDEALAFLAGDGHRWVEMQQQAMNARFDWVAAAEQYIKLY
jgi:starch synthase